MMNHIQTDDGDSQTQGIELHKWLVDELAGILGPEPQVTFAVPRMAEEAMSEELATAFESSLGETDDPVGRLALVFAALHESVPANGCKAMAALVECGREFIVARKGGSACDAALIAVAQGVECRERASGGSLRNPGERMGCDEAAEYLNAALEEELAYDEVREATAVSAANEP